MGATSDRLKARLPVGRSAPHAVVTVLLALCVLPKNARRTARAWQLALRTTARWVYALFAALRPVWAARHRPAHVGSQALPQETSGDTARNLDSSARRRSAARRPNRFHHSLLRLPVVGRPFPCHRLPETPHPGHARWPVPFLALVRTPWGIDLQVSRSVGATALGLAALANRDLRPASSPGSFLTAFAKHA